MAQAQNTSIDAVSGLQPLSYLNQNQPATVLFVRQSRPPTTNDKNYKFGTLWLDTEANEVFVLINVKANAAIWVLIGGLGAFPITPFVVGKIGDGGFQTIQSAMNAAQDAGGGLVYIQPNTYTENLTFFDKVSLASIIDVDSSPVIIIGTHTPATSGAFSIRGCTLDGTAAILNSTAAGSANISFEECFFSVTDGFICDLVNWTGDITIKECDNNSANDGIFNNTGGSRFFSKNSVIGQGVNRVFTMNGNVRMDTTQISCGMSLSGGQNLLDHSLFVREVTFSGTASVIVLFCAFNEVSLPAITATSSNIITLINCSVDTANSPAIDGTSTVELADVTFVKNNDLASTLTLSGTPEVKSGSFATVVASQNTGMKLADTTISAVGLNSFINLTIAPKGGGDVKINPGSVVIETVGNGLQIKEGVNARMGIATLANGTVIVNNNTVTNNTRIFLTHQSLSGAFGAVGISARSAGFNFQIQSLSGADNGVVAWMMVEPA